MASSEGFKRILELYNQESKSSGVSTIHFNLMLMEVMVNTMRT